MRNCFRRFTTALLASTLLVVPCPAQPGPAAGGDRARARELGYSGVRAYGAGNYSAASAQLEQAFSLLAVPSLGLWSARSLAQLGKLVEAEARYRRIGGIQLDPDAPAVQHAARATAALEHDELLPRLPLVHIELGGAPPEQVLVTLDGVLLPVQSLTQALPVNPGIHNILGTRQGDRSEVIVTAIEGRTEHVVLRFSSPPRELEPLTGRPAAQLEREGLNPWRLGAWIAVGSGGASLVVSGVAYLVGRHDYSELEQDGICSRGVCRDSTALDDYFALRSLHVATLIAGAALGVAGATVLWIEPGAPSSDPGGSALGVQLGVGSASLVGRF
ncbi:MAG: hypothetical protein ABI895_28765 [Deltaproteobacteria bacterium]